MVQQYNTRLTAATVGRIASCSRCNIFSTLIQREENPCTPLFLPASALLLGRLVCGRFLVVTPSVLLSTLQTFVYTASDLTKMEQHHGWLLLPRPCPCPVVISSTSTSGSWSDILGDKHTQDNSHESPLHTPNLKK